MKEEYCLSEGKLSYINEEDYCVPVEYENFVLKNRYGSARVVNLQNKFGVYVTLGKNKNTGTACDNVIPVGDYLIFHNDNGDSYSIVHKTRGVVERGKQAFIFASKKIIVFGGGIADLREGIRKVLFGDKAYNYLKNEIFPYLADFKNKTQLKILEMVFNRVALDNYAEVTYNRAGYLKDYKNYWFKFKAHEYADGLKTMCEWLGVDFTDGYAILNFKDYDMIIMEGENIFLNKRGVRVSGSSFYTRVCLVEDNRTGKRYIVLYTPFLGGCVLTTDCEIVCEPTKVGYYVSNGDNLNKEIFVTKGVALFVDENEPYICFGDDAKTNLEYEYCNEDLDIELDVDTAIECLNGEISD